MGGNIPFRGPLLEILRFGMICRNVLQISTSYIKKNAVPLSIDSIQRSDGVGDAFQNEDQN